MSGGSENWLPRPSLATFLPSFQLPSNLPSAGYTTRAVSRAVILSASAEGTSLRNLLQACSVSSGLMRACQSAGALPKVDAMYFSTSAGSAVFAAVWAAAVATQPTVRMAPRRAGAVMRVIVMSSALDRGNVDFAAHRLLLQENGQGSDS